jgi:hypothetical protein
LTSRKNQAIEMIDRRQETGDRRQETGDRREQPIAVGKSLLVKNNIILIPDYR